MKDSIIKDFDQFKEVNESDQTLFQFLMGQAGPQLTKALKQKATSYILSYMGIPEGEDPSNPEGKGQWIREIFVKLVANLSMEEIEDIIEGRIKFTNEEFWAERLAKTLKEQIIDSGVPSARDVINLLGVTPGGFIGRLITNSWREYILDEKKLEQTIIGAWRLMVKEEFIPQRDADEIYKDSLSKLTPEQRKKVEGTTWSYSVKQSDLLKRKGG